MFDAILKEEVQDYISANLHTDLHTLLLKESPFTEVSMQEIVQQIKGHQVAKIKFSELVKKGIVYPKKLSLEQASSTFTGEYKRTLVKGESMVDLTTGFGIDAMHLAKNFQEVTLVEQDKDLIKRVQYNWEILNLSANFVNDNLHTFLSENQSVYDVVYLDPARRDATQKKVFLLEDLSPNILEIRDQLDKAGKQVLIKLSPLLDIHYLTQAFSSIKEIHIVAVKNEVKELVLLLDRSYNGPLWIHSVNLATQEPMYSFIWDSSKTSIEYSDVLNYLYLPNNAILKSGNFNGIATDFNLKKLAPNTHLYTSNSRIDKFPGRVLPIKEISSKDIKKGEYYNIISKNHPLKPSQIKKKYGLKDGGNNYLIFTQSKKKKIILKSYD